METKDISKASAAISANDKTPDIEKRAEDQSIASATVGSPTGEKKPRRGIWSLLFGVWNFVKRHRALFIPIGTFILGGILPEIVYDLGCALWKRTTEELNILRKEIVSYDQGRVVDTIYPALYEHHNKFDSLRIELDSPKDYACTIIRELNPDPYPTESQVYKIVDLTDFQKEKRSIYVASLKFDQNILSVGGSFGAVPKKLLIHFMTATLDKKLCDSQTLDLEFKDRNRFDLNDWASIASFVTSDDEDIKKLAREICQLSAEHTTKLGIEKQIKCTILLFNSLSYLGLECSKSQVAADYALFPRQILHYLAKTKGKSQVSSLDLAILYMTFLESIEIRCAIIKVKEDYLVLAQIQGKTESAGAAIGDLYTLTIPVELCAVGNNFQKAWIEGARKYYSHGDKSTVDIQSAQHKYPQAKTYKFAEWDSIRTLSIDEINKLNLAIHSEWTDVLKKITPQAQDVYQRPPVPPTVPQQQPIVAQEVRDPAVAQIIRLLERPGVYRLDGVSRLENLSCDVANDTTLLRICREILRDQFEDEGFVKTPIRRFLNNCGF